MMKKASIYSCFCWQLTILLVLNMNYIIHILPWTSCRNVNIILKKVKDFNMT